MFVIFNAKYNLDLKYKHYENLVITESDYDALLWIKSNLGENNVFITPYFMTSATYPISKNEVISIIPAQLEGGLREENLNFYNYDCDKQEDLIGLSNVQYVLSRIELNCNFLEEIYSDKTKVYRVTT